MKEQKFTDYETVYNQIHYAIDFIILYEEINEFKSQDFLGVSKISICDYYILKCLYWCNDNNKWIRSLMVDAQVINILKSNNIDIISKIGI
jgi:hypothetical protein